MSNPRYPEEFKIQMVKSSGRKEVTCRGCNGPSWRAYAYNLLSPRRTLKIPYSLS